MSQAQFLEHQRQYLAQQLHESPERIAVLAGYISQVGGLDQKTAMKLAGQNSPSAKKIMELLKPDEEAELHTPEKIDEAHVKQHDYRAITTHTPQTEPYTPNYSLFSVPAGQPLSMATNKTQGLGVPLAKTGLTINTIEITDEEKEQAIKTRKAFEEMLDKMNLAFEHLNTLHGALDGVQDSTQLEPLRKLFKQFKRRVQHLFNDFIDALEVALKEMNQTVSDSEMERLQDTVVAEVREIRDGAEKLLVMLKTPEDPDFIKDFGSTVERLNTRRNSLDEVVEDGVFSHIDSDILAKIRLG